MKKAKIYKPTKTAMQSGQKKFDKWIIEFEKAPENLNHFSSLLDEALQEENSDYEAKRYKNMTLHSLKVHKAKKGLFYEWISKKGKLGGQHKVPRLSNSREILEELLAEID